MAKKLSDVVRELADGLRSGEIVLDNAAQRQPKHVVKYANVYKSIYPTSEKPEYWVSSLHDTREKAEAIAKGSWQSYVTTVAIEFADPGVS